jgi:hypothetical protein
VRRVTVLVVLVVLVVLAGVLLAPAAGAKQGRRYWCGRAAKLQRQVDMLAAQRDALAAQGMSVPGSPAFVFPLYRVTPEDLLAKAQARCTKGR